VSGATRVVAGALVRCALRGDGARALPHLVVRAPAGAERAVPLPPELTVGRGPGAALTLDDPGASRLHARIRLSEGGAAEVEDLGSKNGLVLNGRPVPRGPTPLRTGDELTVGATVLRFVDPLAGVPGEASPPPAAAGPPGGAPRAGGTRAALLLGAAAGLLGLAAISLAVG
jgi:hypothetical protein